MMKLKEKVQSLIDSHQYDEAITLLGNVDSPHATDWVRRIEAMRTAHFRKAQWQSGWFMAAAFFTCAASLVICSLLNM